MSHPAPQLLPLCQWPPGVLCDGFALLTERTTGHTREGKNYYQFTFQDRRRRVAIMIWADSPHFEEAEHWVVGGRYKLRGVYQDHPRYGAQVTLHDLRPINPADAEHGYREAELYDRSRFDSTAMFTELVQLVETELKHEALQALVLKLLTDNELSLKELPATENRFFTYPGGWLEHTLNVCRHVLLLADQYKARYPEQTPPLNRDLILAGAALHELGRVKQYALPTVPGAPVALTTEGRFYGHVMLARDMIRTAAATLPDFPAETLLLLEHIVLSHLTLPKWGSPRLPLIAEVLILHHADDMDAKLEMYRRVYELDVQPGAFTHYDPVLKKELYKPTPPPEAKP
jgi:3'-5' exoribonuclease